VQACSGVDCEADRDVAGIVAVRVEAVRARQISLNIRRKFYHCGGIERYRGLIAVAHQLKLNIARPVEHDAVKIFMRPRAHGDSLRRLSGRWQYAENRKCQRRGKKEFFGHKSGVEGEHESKLTDNTPG
jgi:hypothetical protein